MSPCMPLNDVTNCGLAYGVNHGKSGDAKFRMSFDIGTPDVDNIILCQNGSSMFGPPWHTFNVGPSAIGVALGRSIPEDSILAIIEMGTDLQMGRFDTGRIATTRAKVTDKQAVWYRASMSMFPYPLMSWPLLTLDHEFRVIATHLTFEGPTKIDQQATSIFISDKGQKEDIVDGLDSGPSTADTGAKFPAPASPCRISQEGVTTLSADQLDLGHRSLRKYGLS